MNMSIYSTTGRTSRANRRVELNSREGGRSSPNEREDLASIVKGGRLRGQREISCPLPFHANGDFAQEILQSGYGRSRMRK